MTTVPAALLSGVLTAFCMRMGAYSAVVSPYHASSHSKSDDVSQDCTRRTSASQHEAGQFLCQHHHARMCFLAVQVVLYQTSSPQSTCDLDPWVTQTPMQCCLLHSRIRR